ncbi:MAG: UbiD family decarboxylase [Dehalococcoidia bacterium]|nr:MAG: UbiD family decarboxylase [Dehalococcoidia bacterium]
MGAESLKHIPGSFREAIDFLAARGELKQIKDEVDTVYEISAIEKKLDNGPAFFFENIKGYPGVRDAGNLFARIEDTAAMFGLDDHRKLKFKCHRAIKTPLPPKIVSKAPSQEIVITANIDISTTLPLIKHSPDDAGPMLGGGVALVKYPAEETWEISFKRMYFRGKDWGSINIIPATHLGKIAAGEFTKGSRVPLTINIGVSPAVMMMAAAYAIHTVVPDGTDELAIAGALQEAPVEICKAKTVDAYAIADSEWVIEGYALPEKIFETDEAEKLGKAQASPFAPEWAGYLAKALKPPKFQVTAITHRQDRPIFYTPLAASFETENLSRSFREACFYDIAEGIAPGLVTDVNIPYGIRANSGAVYQVKKRFSGDDSFVKNILSGALGVSMSRLILAVDDDVNIYSADDILWAIATRANTQTGFNKAPPGSAAVGYVLNEYAARTGAGGGEGIAIDATAPYAARPSFQRAHYPSDTVDVSKWLTQEEIAAIRTMQSDYARFLADIGG